MVLQQAARLALALVLLLVAASLLPGCGRAGEPRLSLLWRVAGSADLADGAPLATFVELRNLSDKRARQVELRFNPSQAGGAHTGLSIGTISNAASRFDGPAQVWELGDLPPDALVRFEIGLWFDSALATSGEQWVALSVQITSPDLAAPVSSNVLRLNAARGRQ
jgi:hypothetical protein